MEAASLSYDMTKGVDRETKGFLRTAKAVGAGIFLTTSVPGEKLAVYEAQVAALKPKERKKWKGRTQDAFGQFTIVRYNEAGIDIPGKNYVSHFENKMSAQKKGKLQTDQEWRPLVPIGLPVVDLPEGTNQIIEMRRGNDELLDNMSTLSQHLAFQAEVQRNTTGNHTSRNHQISVPTVAGQPVRG